MQKISFRDNENNRWNKDAKKEKRKQENKTKEQQQQKEKKKRLKRTSEGKKL